mgnify:CR=1 FL=1
MTKQVDNFVCAYLPPPPLAAKLQQEPDFSENVAEIARWFEHEQNEDSSNWYPLRPSELTEIEEDPHRAVLFEGLYPL